MRLVNAICLTFIITSKNIKISMICFTITFERSLLTTIPVTDTYNNNNNNDNITNTFHEHEFIVEQRLFDACVCCLKYTCFVP